MPSSRKQGIAITNRSVMVKKQHKLYIVRKYVMARSAREAIELSRNREPDDVWVDDEWKKDSKNQLSSAIGFEMHGDD